MSENIKVKNTRQVTVKSRDDKEGRYTTFTANDEEPLKVNVYIKQFSSSASVEVNRQDLLDAMIEMWPEAVAYQFKDGDDEG